MKPVRITSKDLTSDGVKVCTAEGAEVQGIVGIDVKVRVNDLVRAEIELTCTEIDIQADAKFMVMNPETGEMLEVKRIEFANGDVVDL